MNTRLIACSDEVANALREARPVVALETTLLAHGLPWPTNWETALEAAQAIADRGAVPAWIGVVAGQIQVGLEAATLERFARGGDCIKVSRRDLAAAVAQKRNAATTVSATLFIAARAGLCVMATGGLGGVHRGAQTSFDVSTDLDQLARADGMLLVCSGAKMILDLPATLEMLETLGVPVVGYRSSTLPGFTVASSGLPLEWRVETAAEAAALWRVHRDLGTPGALVLAQQVPNDVALDATEAHRVLQVAIDQAHAQNISGKAVTPFLLESFRRETDGRSLAANRALIVANSALAAEVAGAARTS